MKANMYEHVIAIVCHHNPRSQIDEEAGFFNPSLDFWKLRSKSWVEIRSRNFRRNAFWEASFYHTKSADLVWNRLWYYNSGKRAKFTKKMPLTCSRICIDLNFAHRNPESAKVLKWVTYCWKSGFTSWKKFKKKLLHYHSLEINVFIHTYALT